MIVMVGDPKDLLNDGRHAFGRPDISPEAICRRPLSQEPRELRALFLREAGLSARGRLMLQGLAPASSGTGYPLAHGALGHAKRGGNIFLLPPLLVQFPAAEAATFAPIPCLFRCCGSHRNYATRH